MVLYETHLHTREGSKCGRSTGREHARFYAEQGYQGIIVTDHFFGGNVAVDPSLPWEEQVRLFCYGYEEAKDEGKRLGLDVFFGWESTFEGDDYLVYGLDQAWLLAHPEVTSWNRAEQFAQVHAYGGCVVQAHPFRERDYLSRILLGDRFSDAIEAANAGNSPLSDACAWKYAQENHLMVTAGSDNHRSGPETKLMGIALSEKLNGIEDYIHLIRKREPIKLLVSSERFVLPEGESLHLPCFLLTEQEEKEEFHRLWLPEKIH